jgi:predicted TIM-barrel fold metal-dependent hydrolase
MPMIRYAVDAVGSDRVAFGTDFPFNPSHEQLRMREQVESLGLGQEELDRVAGGNVTAFLGAGQPCG